jgi:hypothetical protein
MAEKPNKKTVLISISAERVQPPAKFNLEGDMGESFEIQPPPNEVLELIDWNNPKNYKEYVRLEQKVLAKKADLEDRRRYEQLKRDRNSGVFADRYFRDYAEVQRLKALSEKLAEIQQYLKPIEI